MLSQIALDRAHGDDEVSGARNGVVRNLSFVFAYGLSLLAGSALLVLLCETILRGSITEAGRFLVDPARPGWATVLCLALVLAAVDAISRRVGQSFLVVAPVVLTLAWVGSEKRFYLGDPPYPTDFLYARQIVELMPLMAAERPLALAAIMAGIIGAVFLLILGWRWARRLPRVTLAGRVARLAVAVPALVLVAMQMDYASHSDLRGRLKIEPMMWDQKANYHHNGLVMAFALNVPMANVAAPAGYGSAALDRIAEGATVPYVPAEQPDIIMVMSESFWDATRLPDVSITPDPLAFTSSVLSGHVFSPEFGGMTANVEFEALTGFSNAFLPYGSIPYQQYVRRETPSLASFLGSQGYDTLAIHPFQGWFWNRTSVYEDFGFDRFLSEENLPELAKRGRLASDDALVDEIMRQADAADAPIFLFSVTLQNHGPYEAGRYPDSTLEVTTKADEATRDAIHTFAEGMADSDDSLRRLVEWAQKRERETVVVYFGDHLPPLGPTYVATGFLERNVGDRVGPLSRLAVQRETPLVIWSNRTGRVDDIETVSPAFLPLHTLRAAGIEHPFYTGMLSALHDRYRIIDRHLLVSADGTSARDWQRSSRRLAELDDYRLVQHDALFGDGHGVRRLFPQDGPLMAAPSEGPLERRPL